MVAAGCVNRPRDFMTTNRMLGQGAAVDTTPLPPEVAV
ncbi:hypothetical protein [Dietzia maris]|nr:hypothetical protein [Dietzia sp. PP-33]